MSKSKFKETDDSPAKDSGPLKRQNDAAVALHTAATSKDHLAPAIAGLLMADLEVHAQAYGVERMSVATQLLLALVPYLGNSGMGWSPREIAELVANG